MYKAKKLILENLLLKKGKKWKTENLIKKTFKNLQVIDKQKKVLDLFKNALILHADGFNINKQTLKKGKKKKLFIKQFFWFLKKVDFPVRGKGLQKQFYSKKQSLFLQSLLNKYKKQIF